MIDGSPSRLDGLGNFAHPSSKARKVCAACTLLQIMPGCGCSVMFHDAVNQIGNELVPHYENCGPCWRSVNMPFAQSVVDHTFRSVQPRSD